MDVASLMPAYPPLPLPLPAWLLQTLLVVGFWLHALPMNIIFGGGFLTAALFYAGRKGRTSYPYRAARMFAIALPVFISFAITQGIVPLLFVQLLYGPAFYTSSILMAVPWLSVVGVVVVSYYIAYAVIYRILRYDQDSASGAGKAAMLILLSSIGFAVVGFIFTNNLTLMLTPDKWAAMYQHSSHGLNLNTSEPQLTPRYLHSFLASTAVAGLMLGLFGNYFLKREEDFGKWMIKLGSRIFLGSTLCQVLVGIWFLKAIPGNFAAQFLGGDTFATAVFALSMVLALLSIVTGALTTQSGSGKMLIVTTVVNALTILSMIINRHQLRLMYLSPVLKPESQAVAWQTDLFIIFLVSAVALILYLIWLCKLVWGAFHPTAPVSTQS